eukprot:CAMPEP_0184552414 /NCGR_PEP_ID=MMETSP0199_2-20130426/28928_1 /TAXON_ID=1112570 /ORGANISM="Thraustochytrium sp., Strain LLF1b" /LENGTH=48 /DNA_ID= /DNA_START= /DNA_END= /DNA_ORIENTATION=
MAPRRIIKNSPEPSVALSWVSPNISCAFARTRSGANVMVGVRVGLSVG